MLKIILLIQVAFIFLTHAEECKPFLVTGINDVKIEPRKQSNYGTCYASAVSIFLSLRYPSLRNVIVDPSYYSISYKEAEIGNVNKWLNAMTAHNVVSGGKINLIYEHINSLPKFCILKMDEAGTGPLYDFTLSLEILNLLLELSEIQQRVNDRTAIVASLINNAIDSDNTSICIPVRSYSNGVDERSESVKGKMELIIEKLKNKLKLKLERHLRYSDAPLKNGYDKTYKLLIKYIDNYKFDPTGTAVISYPTEQDYIGLVKEIHKDKCAMFINNPSVKDNLKKMKGDDAKNFLRVNTSQPAMVSYCSNQLERSLGISSEGNSLVDKMDQCGGHAATIVGQKIINYQCFVVIKNTTKCIKPIHYNSNYSCDGENELINKDKFLDSVLDVTY
jgi:hypothetical protein